MVKLDQAVIARYDHEGEKFEILVDPDLALRLKKGDNVNFDDLLVIDTVFKDAGKGSAQSPDALNKAFGSTNVTEIAEKIIKQGEVQLTTEQRRNMREAKRREVIDSIAKNTINPQTNAPHPAKRIENALTEAKIHVDEMKSVEEQLPAIMKELKKILPISMEKLRIAVRIPAQFSGKASPILHKYELKKEEWQKDGSIIAVVELPGGLKNDLLNELNHITHGNVETKILEGK